MKYVTILSYRLALKNFEQCVKPGGLLLIDHRNYDHILQSGHTPSKCIYYNVSENKLFNFLNNLFDFNKIWYDRFVLEKL